MEILTLILFSLGILLFIWGALWLLLLMFQTSIWWGVSQIILVGIPGIFYSLQHWRVARFAFSVWFFGLLTLGGAGLMGLPNLDPIPVEDQSSSQDGDTDAESPEINRAGFVPGNEADSAQQSNERGNPQEDLRQDPGNLQTAAEIRAYAEAIQIQERKLKTQQESLDRNNPADVAEFDEATAFLRQRAQELKAAALRLQQERARDEQSSGE